LAKVGVGLDIGTSSIKVVELEAGKPIRVNRFGRILLSEDALVGGVIKNREMVSKAIVELLQKTKIKHKKLQAAIAGQSVIVRMVKMPLMSEEELANAIRWEAERYIPFSIDEVCLDFVIISKDTQQQEMEVMLVCAHNDIIYSHYYALKEAGIQPLAIDIQPFALMRSLGLTRPGDSESVAVIDLGAGTTDMTITKDGISRFTRIIPLAGNRFTENISQRLGVDFARAEELKIQMADALFNLNDYNPDSLEYQVNFVVQETLQELTLEIRRSFDYYQLQQRNEPITKLILAGGGSKLKNLIPFLNQEFGMEITLAQEAQEITLADKKLQNEFDELKPILMVAYGLALREVIEE